MLLAIGLMTSTDMNLINDHGCIYDTATRHLLEKLAALVDESKTVYVDPGNKVYHWPRGPNDFKVKLETAATAVRELLLSAVADLDLDIREGRTGTKPFIEIYVTRDVQQPTQKPQSALDWDDDFN